MSDSHELSLLESIPDLDGRTSGVLLNSDNYQALQFLLARYEKQVQSIYIDPPYNTDASPIMYKNGYKDTLKALEKCFVSISRFRFRRRNSTVGGLLQSSASSMAYIEIHSAICS